jgi:hypothetical protein
LAGEIHEIIAVNGSCAKRDTYPDGKVFVGPGVSVDVNIVPSIKDYLDDRDVVLAKALMVLK